MGIVVLYGGGITDALNKPDATDAELEALLAHARSVLEQQGDLAGGIEKLEAELERRRGTTGS